MHSPTFASAALSRRRLLAGALLLPIMNRTTFAQTPDRFDKSRIRALTFDTQGTVVDFYDPFLRAGRAISARRHVELDWPKLIVDWVTAVGVELRSVAMGTRTWVPVGAIQAETLDRLLRGTDKDETIKAEDCEELIATWSRMEPWPDTPAGLAALRKNHVLATLTNMTMASALAIVRRNNLPFDTLLTADLVRNYKPSPTVYRMAIDELGVSPNQILMVSAHKWDLQAAKSCGLATAFVPRPLENGPGAHADESPEVYIDMIARDFSDLASQLAS